MQSTASPRTRQDPITPPVGILPLIDVKRLGSASRTLAALVDIADQDRHSTFKSLGRIGRIAGLSVATVARHLVILEGEGYIVSSGRQNRRTVTYRLVRTADDLLTGGYLPLSKASRDLVWSQAATLAFLTRWAGKDGHLSTSARKIGKELYLSVSTVKKAMAALVAAKLITRGPWPTYWTVRGARVTFDRGEGSLLTFAVNRKLLEPNSEINHLKQEHLEAPSPPTAVHVVFADTQEYLPKIAPHTEGSLKTPPPAPRWSDIQDSDLRLATGRRTLFLLAVKAGIISDTHEKRVYFQACCVQALTADNPGGYLRKMVENGWKPKKRLSRKNGSQNTFEGPKLYNVAKLDLTKPGAAVKLVETQKGPQSEHKRILIAAEASHALRTARDPAALFASNINAGRFYSTIEDEIRVTTRNRVHEPWTDDGKLEPKPITQILAEVLHAPATSLPPVGRHADLH